MWCYGLNRRRSHVVGGCFPGADAMAGGSPALRAPSPGADAMAGPSPALRALSLGANAMAVPSPALRALSLGANAMAVPSPALRAPSPRGRGGWRGAVITADPRADAMPGPSPALRATSPRGRGGWRGAVVTTAVMVLVVVAAGRGAMAQDRASQGSVAAETELAGERAITRRMAGPPPDQGRETSFGLLRLVSNGLLDGSWGGTGGRRRRIV